MLNRAARRKRNLKLVNQVMKGRDAAVAKPQVGFGIVVTNRIIAITFWRWTWVPFDRRVTPAPGYVK